MYFFIGLLFACLSSNSHEVEVLHRLGLAKRGMEMEYAHATFFVIVTLWFVGVNTSVRLHRNEARKKE